MIIKKNLITGGSGFIGTNLSKRLLSKGEKVICIDNFSTCEKTNINAFIDHPNFELIEHDILDPIMIEADIIWHLACPASPKDYQVDPIRTSRTCFIGTYNMLELARKIKAKLLLASSSEIYGDPKEHPQKESYRGSVKTTGIRSCYDEGKRIAETLCKDYQRVYGIKTFIIRIFNSYGPYMRLNDGRVISNFIVQALKDEKITIYGNGIQTRSFCYVDDLIEGMINMINSNYNDPLNLGNPYEISIIELAKLVRDLINPNLEFEFKLLPEDDPQKRQPSIDKSKKILNWEPEVTLNQGLLSTIKWFKHNL